MTKTTAHWLLKTEPETYSFKQLLKDGKTNWNGVRNFQARNHLRGMAQGDLALIYHSGEERSVVGVARVLKEAYPDPDPKKKGEWVQVDLEPLEALLEKVPLSEIKAARTLSDLPLIRQSRLSVMPITAHHYQAILKLASSPNAKPAQGRKK